jgi:thiamine-phosphate pyrophosphorylase
VIHAIVDRALEVLADYVHVRNKEIEPRELLALTRWYVGRGHRVIVNTQADIAMAAGAAGVHLPSGSFAPSRLRLVVPPGFLVGVSCHSREELEQAEEEGADYAYLSPVFRPLSKAYDLTPLGLDGFSRMISGLRMPVIALGGITPERIDECLRAGAAGAAGITLAERLK